MKFSYAMSAFCGRLLPVEDGRRCDVVALETLSRRQAGSLRQALTKLAGAKLNDYDPAGNK
jgi:hypothetical protein